MSEGESKLPILATPKLKSKGILLAGLLIIAALIGYVLWQFQGRIVSVSGVVDGMIYTIAPEISAKLLDVSVREGGQVEKGAVVARLDVQPLQQQVGVASQELFDLRPPDMAEVAGRLKAAETAELDAVQRVAKARHEEEVKKQQFDNWVLAKAQAELRLRGLADQSPTNPTYQRYRHEVLAKTKQMEAARDDFERASRVRAALNQELQRVRYEIQEAKRLASLTRYHKTPSTPKPQVKAQAMPNGALIAPVSGTVLTLSAYPGQMVQKGDPIVLIMPKDPGQGGLWVNAYFNEEFRSKLMVGDFCQVKNLGTQQLLGKIESLGAAGPLPKGQEANTEGRGLYVPVKIALLDQVNLKPGDRVECSLKKKWF